MRATTTVAVLLLSFGCASAPPREQRYTIIRPNESAPQQSGIAPDKEAEIQLVLQQREPSARKCYQDVLNEKNDRNFAGSIKVLIAIQPSGQPSSVRVIGGTLTDRQVQECLVQTIQEFEFPQLASGGEVQYEYRFRPAY